MEDKKLICSLLLLTLQETKGLCNLLDISYKDGIVYVKFENGFRKVIDVSGKDGIDMVKSIIGEIC